MPTFAYTAQGPSGLIQGELSAVDRSEAFALLGRKRLQPVKLEQTVERAASVKASVKGKVAGKPKAEVHADVLQSRGALHLKLPQVVLFTEELSDLLGAGIQLEPALATMES